MKFNFSLDFEFLNKILLTLLYRIIKLF